MPIPTDSHDRDLDRPSSHLRRGPRRPAPAPAGTHGDPEAGDAKGQTRRISITESEPLMRYPITFPISSALVLALGLGPAGCARPSGVAAAAPTPVSVSFPVEREITKYADFTGRLEAVSSVEIRTRVTGYLDRVYFKDGDVVDEGATLFEIDPRPYKVDLDRAEGSAAQTEARLERLEADRRRVVALFNRGAVGREEFDRITGDYKEARASLNVARANRDMARLNIE
ncbi:MAG: rane fusion protein multidrug efflux system, partial [Chloroflexota bacterium]|nr:rane fusion protein multidrug efflux system [Chloroflexota bacterium]